MNHPNHEEWMSFVYDELDNGKRAELAAHLRACPDCAGTVHEWQSVQRQLDTWHVRPAKRTATVRAPAPWMLPALRWAAGVALLLTAGFAAGRASSVTNARELRAAIEPAIRKELKQEFAQQFRADLDKASAATLAASAEQTKTMLDDYARAADTRNAAVVSDIYANLDQMESQRLADYVSLKKDVDTVAVNTDAGLRETERQLVLVADTARPPSIYDHVSQ